MAETPSRLESRRDGVAYADDYAAWVAHQARLLRERRTDELDFDNLIDEVESLPVIIYREYVSALRLVLTHMLKWDYQPAFRSRSWQSSIAVHRDSALDLLSENPSFKSRREAALLRAYRDACREASGETDLPLKDFPAICPYDWTAITTREHPLPGDDA